MYYIVYIKYKVMVYISAYIAFQQRVLNCLKVCQNSGKGLRIAKFDKLWVSKYVRNDDRQKQNISSIKSLVPAAGW